jgi:hypothetical protein
MLIGEVAVHRIDNDAVEGARTPAVVTTSITIPVILVGGIHFIIASVLYAPITPPTV